MSKAIHNNTLEYAANVIEFWMYDEDNMPVNFDNGTTFSITRMDDSTKTYAVVGTVAENKVTFSINPPKNTLYKTGDELFSYDTPKYEHVYSIKSASRVYIIGKLNMVQAG